MQRTKDIVILSAIDWHFIWQRYQIISKLFADCGFNVFYVESTAKRNPKLNDIPRIIKRVFYRKRVNVPGENPIPKRLTVISPVMLPSTWNLFRNANRRFFVKKFIKSLKERGVHRPIVYCYLPTQTSLDIIEELAPLLVVYDCVSNFAAFPGIPSDLARTEDRLIQRADLVFADSDYLCREKKGLRNDIKQVLPGVDFDVFSRADTGYVRDVNTLCYFGAIDERIDFRLIGKVAESVKDITIKMVGPVCDKLPLLPSNVVFTGRKKYWDLPDELRDSDCLILPYRINDYTKGIIPSKLFESFATGKPVISTNLPNFDKFKALMTVARSQDEFIRDIKDISRFESEERRKRRIDMARENSWEVRFGEILKYICEAL